MNAMTYSHMGFDELSDLEPTMSKMEEEENLWIKQERTIMDDHRKGKKGLYHVYRKL